MKKHRRANFSLCSSFFCSSVFSFCSLVCSSVAFTRNSSFSIVSRVSLRTRETKSSRNDKHLNKSCEAKHVCYAFQNTPLLNARTRSLCATNFAHSWKKATCMPIMARNLFLCKTTQKTTPNEPKSSPQA